MNTYPGFGVGFTNSLAAPFGASIDTDLLFTTCTIHGKLKIIDGTPAGGSSSTLTNKPDGSGTLLVSSWTGVEVTATIAVADAINGSVITTTKAKTTTNSTGYFSFKVIQGLTAVVTCPVFGKTVSIDTTGATDIDISTFF